MRWAVIGGGILGLVLALRLRQRGSEVVVYEAAPELGGLAGAWRLGDVKWDRHYHVILGSDRHTIELVRELGLGAELCFGRTKTGFYTGGELHSMSSTAEFLRFPPLDLVSKLRLGATIFYASRLRDFRRLEHVDVEGWLEGLSGRRTFERIWRPLLVAKLGDSYEQASAAFIWATIARMYAARSAKRRQEELGYVRGGYGRVFDRFARVLAEHGVTVRTSAAVRRIVAATPGSGLSVEPWGGSPEVFDRAVATVPAPVAARLCPGLTTHERLQLASVPYQGIVCSALLLRRPLSEHYITNITDDFVPFTAVIEMTALVPREEVGGRTLVYLPKYVGPDDPLFSVGDDELRGRFLAALSRMYPAFDPGHVLAFQTSRVRYVFPIPTIGYSSRMPPMETSVRGLYLASSAQIPGGTLNVNETLKLARRALGRLL